MNVPQLSGVFYGDIAIQQNGETIKCDAVFFKVFPLTLLRITFQETMIMAGDRSLEKSFHEFIKKAPEELKSSSLFFEFREFHIDKNQKIKAKIVVPYMVGMPTVPLRSFTVNRGIRAEKTMLSFNNINYTDSDGLSVAFFLRLREKIVAGDYDLKLYERHLFKLEGPKRGVLFSGENRFFPTAKQKDLLGFTTLLNSGEKSFNLLFKHNLDTPFFRYSLAQAFSGRENQPAFFEFRSDVTIKKLKPIEPRFDFTFNWKKSYSYKLSTPITLLKKWNFNVSWQRKIIADMYQSDTSDFSTGLGFDARLFSLSSNYNFSKDWLAASVRKNFAVTVRMKPVLFLEDNIALDLSSFYMFSSLPFGNATVSRVSPGVTMAIRSVGAVLPWGLRLVPSFGLNHLWDNRQESFTDFNYVVALRKQSGDFSASIDYSVTSRYRAADFWVEGNNRQNLNLNFQLEDNLTNKYAFLLRFYYNNNLVMENISLTGKWSLPYDLSFSSFVLYYNQERKFQTIEIFLEKTFKKKIKLQGGYSLALKRFFIKFLTQ